MGFQFEKLEVWKRSKALAVAIHLLARRGGWEDDWDMRSQIKRSSISISSNISEGMERDSIKDTLRMLRIAKGSTAEVITQLIITKEAGLADLETVERLLQEARIVAGMLVNFIRHLSARTSKQET